MTEGEVFSVEADEENREDKDHDQGDAEEDDDEEKIRLVGGTLLDFHKELDAGEGAWGCSLILGLDAGAT
jgi:hypothetical protein